MEGPKQFNNTVALGKSQEHISLILYSLFIQIIILEVTHVGRSKSKIRAA